MKTAKRRAPGVLPPLSVPSRKRKEAQVNILDQLEDLERKATRGRWKRSRLGGCKAISGNKAGEHRQAQYQAVAQTVGLQDEATDAANADLIVAMRNALPALLRVARAAKAVHECPVDSLSLPMVYDELRDALAELTKEAT